MARARKSPMCYTQGSRRHEGVASDSPLSMANLYIPKIVELGSALLQQKTPGASLIVWSQVDNAGGHGLGFTLDQLNRLGAIAHRYIRIHFYTQPPNSPDLNVLDLGAWQSLQKAVPPIVYNQENSELTNQERIIAAVHESFMHWNAREKCTSLFETLKAFMAESLISGGDNQKQPHKKNLMARITSSSCSNIPRSASSSCATSATRIGDDSSQSAGPFSSTPCNHHPTSSQYYFVTWQKMIE